MQIRLLLKSRKAHNCVKGGVWAGMPECFSNVPEIAEFRVTASITLATRNILWFRTTLIGIINLLAAGSYDWVNDVRAAFRAVQRSVTNVLRIKARRHSNRVDVCGWQSKIYIISNERASCAPLRCFSRGKGASANARLQLLTLMCFRRRIHIRGRINLNIRRRQNLRPIIFFYWPNQRDAHPDGWTNMGLYYSNV